MLEFSLKIVSIVVEFLQITNNDNIEGELSNEESRLLLILRIISRIVIINISRVIIS